MDPTSAKQFLISKVVEEAEFEHVALSETEKKMLCFTEVHPSLPDIYEVYANSNAAVTVTNTKPKSLAF
jgi:hypothetical protein